MTAEEDFAPILAFDTDESEFVRGFEAGCIWNALKQITDEDYDRSWVKEIVHASNAEMFLRMAEATGLHHRANRLDDTWIEVMFCDDPDAFEFRESDGP